MPYSEKILDLELRTFNQLLKNFLKSRIGLLDVVVNYIIKKKGKQLRPQLVFLSAKLNGSLNEKTYRAAACIEILHTATLIHDDVVDDSMQRRNFFSINALWKNKIAVLAGDYLLSKGLLLALKHKDFETLEILSEAVQNISEAELLQLEKARNFSANEATYFEIIEGKTASLFSASCILGLIGQEKIVPEKAEQMKLLGKYLGIAFQIKDDILDYSSHFFGKPAGQDLKDKKLTLPLIYAFEKMSNAEKNSVIQTIKKDFKNRKAMQKIIQQCHECGGVLAAQEKMKWYSTACKEILNQYPDSPFKQAFYDLIEQLIIRTD